MRTKPSSWLGRYHFEPGVVDRVLPHVSTLGARAEYCR